MTMKLPLLLRRKHLTTITCYAPTTTNPDEVKAKIYVDLQTDIAIAPKADKLAFLGTFMREMVVTAPPGMESAEWVTGIATVSYCFRLMPFLNC